MVRNNYPTDRSRFDRKGLEIKSVTEFKPMLENIVKAYFSKDSLLHELMLGARKALKDE